MKSASRWKSLAYGLGAFLLLISASRYAVGGDIIGTVIAGTSGFLAIFAPLLLRNNSKHED